MERGGKWVTKTDSIIVCPSVRIPIVCVSATHKHTHSVSLKCFGLEFYFIFSWFKQKGESDKKPQEHCY